MSEWIAWSGGECPLPRDARVHVVLSNGRVADWDLCGMKPNLFDWSDKGRPFVARYKILWEPQRDPNAHDSVRKQPEWDGEGLPPVGAVVEVLYQQQWHECEIIGHFMQRAAPVAAFTVARECGLKDLSARRQDCFRPIRSDEEKAVDDAMQDIGAEVGDQASIKGVIERMLAAGYRKTDNA